MTSVRIEGQGSLLAVAYDADVPRQQQGGGARGVVTEFSRASRTRLLRKIARLQPDKAVFITLTYGAQFPDAQGAKDNLRALMERLRRAYPGMSAIWRLEFQKRGAPHFHLICFNLPYLPHKELRRMWGQITIRYATNDQLPFVRIEMIRSRKGVMFYAAKYVAKVESAVGGVSLTSTHICTPEESIGRFWGVHNASALPYAARVMVEVWNRIGDRALAEVKRYFRRMWGRVNKDRNRGAVIFSDHARRKAMAAVRICMEYGVKAHVEEL